MIASAFFSGMEIAFVSANKLRLELDKKHNAVHAFFLNLFTKDPGQYIATMLVGNNIALVIYGISFAKLVEPVFITYLANDTLVLLAQTIASTALILLTAEFLPKTVFSINPNLFLNVFLIPVGFFYLLFYPITYVTIAISKSLLRHVFKARFEEDPANKVFGKVDLDHLMSEVEASGGDEEHEIENEVKLFRNALDFSNVKLRECMVPRTEISALSEESSMEDLRQMFVESGHSKVLIFRDNIDNVVGYIHALELFKRPTSLKELVNDLIIVPETMSASKLFNRFIQESRSIALVVDEFGGTSGLVTTEDILEEIFGEIEDEHDSTEMLEKKISDSEFLFSGRLELDYINDTYNLGFSESEEYETLAGYILFNHQSIPKINSVITIGKAEFKILKATHTKIEIVMLKMLDATEN
ncbi:HlyC/CorC family transporter [Puteibacter caeruleilacunae]|nr:HlyC/CorC family transporter [Puteibacter caeruleilacunae]